MYIIVETTVCDIICWPTERILLESLWFGIYGILLCFYQFILKKIVFRRGKMTLRIKSAVSTGSHGKYMKWRSLPWSPVVAARDSKRRAQALDSSRIYGSRQTVVIPSIQFCPSDPAIRFKAVQKTISRSKSRLLWQSVRLKGRRLNVFGYTHHRLYLCTTFTILFIWQHRCFNY